MGFNISSMTPKLLENIGAYSQVAVGMTTMVSGTATVTISALRRVDGIVGMVQGASGEGETVICTATSTNTATLETVTEGGAKGGTSVVMWMAWGIPAA